MSKTPRTDLFMSEQEKKEYPPPPYPIADFARQLESENAELREALASIVKDRDERSFDIERFVTDELLPSGYWSPSATMVGSEPINRARALLAKVNE